MTLKEALEIIKSKEKNLKPLNGMDYDTFFCFFMVNDNSEAIGNNATYLIGKDKKYLGWHPMSSPFPDKYIKNIDENNIKNITSEEIEGIWNTL